MSRDFKSVVVLLGVVFWCGSSLFAAEDKPVSAERQSRLLQRMPGADADGDGVLSPAEMRAAMAGARGGNERPGAGVLAMLVPANPAEILKAEPQADKDGDGKLSPAEREEYLDSQREALMAELLAAHPGLDTNGDKRLAPDEMRAGRREVEQFVAGKVLAAHPEADKDGDGQLSPEEMRAFHAAQSAGRPDSPMAHVDWAIRNFRQLDRDGNGQVSPEELQTCKQELASKDRPGAARPGADGQGVKQRQKGQAQRQGKP